MSLPPPPEVVDYILSFLQSDFTSLQACSQSHPTISKPAERYLYARVTLHDNFVNDSDPSEGGLRISELTKVLSNKPYISNYVRDFKVVFLQEHSLVHSYLEAVAVILPQFPILKRIALCTHTIPTVSWNMISSKFCQAFVEYIQSKSIREVFIGRIDSFPLSVLNHSTSVKNLTLQQCYRVHFSGETQGALPPSPIEGLDIQDCYFEASCVENIIAWLQTCRLRRLKIYNIHTIKPNGFLPRLLNSCSNSLTDLLLDVKTIYRWGFILMSNTKIIPNLSFLPVLTSLPHLKQLTIHLCELLYCSPRNSRHQSVLPVITHLVGTSSSSPLDLHLKIDYFFTFSEESSNIVPPPDFIWSPLIPLAAECTTHATILYLTARFAIGESVNCTYMPMSVILSSVAGCQGLAPYLETKVLNVIAKDS